MDTTAAPWRGARLLYHLRDTTDVTELRIERVLEDLLDHRMPAVPCLRHSDLLQLSHCSQGRRHPAAHFAAPEALRARAQPVARVTRGTVSRVAALASGARTETQAKKAQANIGDEHGNHNGERR